MAHVELRLYGLLCFVIATLTPSSYIHSEDYRPLLAELYCSVRYLEPAECLQILEQVPPTEIAVVVHDSALERKSGFRHETGYVESLRLLALKASEAENRKQLDSTIDQIEMRLRSIVLFDTHSGYVDSDPARQVEDWKPSSSARYRGIRSIALRLEALRALEEIALIAGRDAPFSDEELSKLVHDYNPTYVANSRSDLRLKSRNDWTVIERAQIALLASLLHFPEEPEVAALLSETASKCRSVTVLQEGVIAAVFPLFVYRLMQATEAELNQLFDWLNIRPTRFAADKQVPEGAFYELAEIINSVFDEADLGSRRYFPEDPLKIPNYEGRWRLASQARTEAVYRAVHLVRSASIKRLHYGYESLSARLRDATYIRSRWIGARWNLSEDNKAAEAELFSRLEALDQLSAYWLQRLEQSVSSTESNATLEHKAILITELLWLYDEISEGTGDPFYPASIDRLRRLIRNADDENTLCGKYQRYILAWEVYEHIKNPDGSVDIILHTRIMNDPPKDISEKASAKYEETIDNLVKRLDTHLKDHYRKDERLRLIAELGFPVSSIYKLEQAQKNEAQKER